MTYTWSGVGTTSSARPFTKAACTLAVQELKGKPLTYAVPLMVWPVMDTITWLGRMPGSTAATMYCVALDTVASSVRYGVVTTGPVGVDSCAPVVLSVGPTCASLRRPARPEGTMFVLDSCSMPAALLAMLPKQAAMDVHAIALVTTVPASSSGV